MSEENESLLDQAGTNTNKPGEDTQTDNGWMWSEGVQAEGDKPDWFKSDKYKSVAAQAEAYQGLESKLGGFTGAPDEETGYEITLPEGVEGEFYEENPLLDNFKDIAFKSNMSQETFTQLLHSYVQNDVSMNATSVESELAQLGDNAQKRLSGIADWGKANMSESEYQDMLSITSTASGVRAVEAMIAKTRTPQIPVNDQDTMASGAPSHAELRERMADPRYQTDADFRAETSKMYERTFGTEPVRQVVG